MTQNKNPAQQGGNIGQGQQNAGNPRGQNPANPNPRSDDFPGKVPDVYAGQNQDGKKQGQMGEQHERGKQQEQQNPRREQNPNVNQPNQPGREQENSRGRANEDQGRKQ